MRRRFRSLAVLTVAVALPVGLVACGDDGGGEDEDQITEAIQTSVTSTNPADCTTFATQAFLEQTEGETGDAAVKSCEENAADTADNPESTEVSEVTVDGDAATADVSFEGGVLGGSTVSVALVKEGDQWKLDELTDIPDFDFEAFKQGFVDTVTAEPDVPPEAADCLVQALDQAGEEKIKQVFLTGDQQQLAAIFQQCGSGG